MFHYGTMKKSIKEHTVSRAGISVRYINYLMSGERNASPSIARALEEATAIPKEVWVFGSRLERERAWKQFERQAREQL